MRWLRAIFAWRTVLNTGMWAYQANGVTGGRRVRVSAVVNGVLVSGYQPVDMDWIGAGVWSKPLPPPHR